MSEKISKIVDDIYTFFTSPGFRKQAIWSLGSVILSLIVSAGIMVLSGFDPGEAFLQLAIGALAAPDKVLFYATPLLLTGLSVALAFKCGLFNIGAEGQLYIGSIAATGVGFFFSMPILVHPLACLAVGALVGGLWGFIPGLLKAYRGAHEVVTTMMLSYTAINLTRYLVTTDPPLGWREQGEFQWNAQTPLLFDTAWLPNIGNSNFLHFGIFIALLAVIGVWFLIYRTVTGYEMRAVGQNMDAAEYSGINSKRKMALALGLSGGLSGLAGSVEIMGTHHRFVDGWSAGLGWDGITVAVLGNNNPWGVLAGAIFFGALKAGGDAMQIATPVPAEMVEVIQGLVVLFVAAPRLIDWLVNRSTELAEWVQEEPTSAGPHLAAIIFSIISLFLGLGLGVTQVASMMMMAVGLLISGFLSLLGFIWLLARNRKGPILAMVSAITWIVSGVLALMVSNPVMLVIAVGLGVFGIIVSILAYRLQEERVKTEVQ